MQQQDSYAGPHELIVGDEPVTTRYGRVVRVTKKQEQIANQLMLDIRRAAAEAAKTSRFTVGTAVQTKFGTAIIKGIHMKGKELEAVWPGFSDPHLVYRIAAKQV